MTGERRGLRHRRSWLRRALRIAPLGMRFAFLDGLHCAQAARVEFRYWTAGYLGQPARVELAFFLGYWLGYLCPLMGGWRQQYQAERSYAAERRRRRQQRG